MASMGTAVSLPNPVLHPHDLNVDLHMHSRASDGVMAPAELVARGVEHGASLLALTDHDTLDGLPEFLEAGADLGLPVLSGVEISVSWGGETLHLVGLDFDPDHPAMGDTLRAMQASRHERARRIDAELMAHGLPSVLDEAMSYAGNPNLIGRAHFARALVARGVCSYTQEVFDRFLTPGKPGYVPQEWARLSDAMGWIQAAGGVPVLAHPARYRLSATAHWALLQEFRALGGHAIEVATGSHSREETRRYQRIAVEQGFAASRGSDFHSVQESRFDVGMAPPLPDATLPVWASRPEWFSRA